MSSLALRAEGDLLADYAAYVRALGITSDCKRVRVRAAECLLALHPDLRVWTARPTRTRVADIKRTRSWPFLAWCFIHRRVLPDLDLLVSKTPGAIYADWRARYADDIARAASVAERFTWSNNWTRQVIDCLGLVCLCRGKSLEQLNDDDLDAFADALADVPSAASSTRKTIQARLHGVRQICYELRVCDKPARIARARGLTLAEHLEAISQIEIRRVALRYLETVSTTLRPGTVRGRAESLIVFGEYLAARHPEIKRLADLDRASHIDPFLAWNHGRPWRGRVARERPVSLSRSKNTVLDLKAFFDDVAVWGWAERPGGRLLFPTDIPKLPRPMPRFLPPDVDRDLMGAVARLEDPFARYGLTILRGTGMRVGELLDLELDCLWDFSSHGTWVRVPLGKLGTERSVPLDAQTLAAFDGWMALRGAQRALPHPRDGRPADFLFVARGRRLTPYRLRRGLHDAGAAAGLSGADDKPLVVKPHQLRHTYGTTLINAGMSLQALMALLGHVSAEMTLRYASLASPTVRAAYEDAMSKVRVRQPLPLVVAAGTTIVPDRVEWLRAEMLKTRVAHGYCSRHLSARACPYANVCEQCDNFVTTPEFLPALQAQLADAQALKDDAEARGWDSEVARHARVIASIGGHVRRVKTAGDSAGIA